MSDALVGKKAIEHGVQKLLAFFEVVGIFDHRFEERNRGQVMVVLEKISTEQVLYKLHVGVIVILCSVSFVLTNVNSLVDLIHD